MRNFGYLLVLIGAVIGGIQLGFTLLFADSAPQQAAGAAMAMAWAVLPYCFARALEKMAQVPFADALAHHRQQEQEQARYKAVSYPAPAAPSGLPVSSAATLKPMGYAPQAISHEQNERLRKSWGN